MVYFVQQTLLFTIPLMIVALAGVFAERSGIINIALEGIMIFGAFIGVLVVRVLLQMGLGPDVGQLILIIAILLSALGGALFALLLGFASIHLKADQTIGGTALNLLSPALVLFLVIIISRQEELNLNSSHTAAGLFMLFRSDFGLGPAKDNIFGVLGDIFFNKVYPTTAYAIIIFVVLSIVLYKTKFGLRLRSCGEHPQASDSLGINVYKMRYIGVAISGALAGFGGFVYAMTAASCAATGDVAGMGFLALAVMIFGNWKPLNIAGAALLFGALKCISVGYPYIDINNDGIFWLKELGISTHIYRVLPYLITIIVLAFTSKKSRAPKAEGQPYDKGKR